MTGADVYIKQMSERVFMTHFKGLAVLPGHTNMGGDACGHWQIDGCLDQDDHPGLAAVKRIKYSCNQADCNKCFESWIRLRASAIASRLVAGALATNNPYMVDKTRSRVILHVTMAPPRENHDAYLDPDGRKQLRAGAIRALRRVGDIEGGCMIDHPYVFSEGLTRAIFKPHFHFLVTGWVEFDKVAAYCSDIERSLNESEGTDERWSVGVVSYLSHATDRQNVFQMARYLLSHAGVILHDPLDPTSKREHTIRWFGKMAYNNAKTEMGFAGQHMAQQQNDIMRHVNKAVKGGDLVDAVISKVEYENVKNAEYTHLGTVDNTAEVVSTIQGVVHEDYLALTKSKTQDDSSPENLPAEETIIQVRFNVRVEKRKKDSEGRMRGTGSFIVKSKRLTIFFTHRDEHLCHICKRRLRLIYTTLDPDLIKAWPPDTAVTVDYVEDKMKYIQDVIGNVHELPSYPYYDSETCELDLIYSHYTHPQDLHLDNRALYHVLRSWMKYDEKREELIRQFKQPTHTDIIVAVRDS